MGLDSYLTGEFYITTYGAGSKPQDVKSILNLMPEFDAIPHMPETVTFELGYWRKDWDLHETLTDRTNGDAGDHKVWVSDDVLKELIADYTDNLRDIPDHDEDDRAYTKNTIKKLNTALVFIEVHGGEVYYSASW